ncbi:SDR family oxidoreductase [Litoribrevibacter albus]|uniref:Short chain dehydrogenase n=1 Tax=Litoribrevibacter albus TaxID=1473156 RepID=A0AA37SAZ6_9GAMM|nr:SDR family oxidoreductase [Litoribrevibacter albus]GLQ31143.1 short chain dehydrogenase [Litoribrevibacter albus]
MSYSGNSLAMSDMFVLLTGATGGIGEALAQALAQRGANLVLTGRNTSKLEQLKTCLKVRFPECQVTWIPADLRSETGISNLVAKIKESNLKINVLINNAGVSDFVEFESQSAEEIFKQLDLNLRSPILMTQKCLPHLKLHPRSMIVNVGSTFGSIGYPGYSLYCASKFGLRGFSEALSRELHDSSVDVVYVAPRATQTNINSATVDLLNQDLGNDVDSPELVAQQIVSAMERGRPQTFFGWPEKLFVLINAIFPNLVTQSISKQLHTIKKYLDVSGRA